MISKVTQLVLWSWCQLRNSRPCVRLFCYETHQVLYNNRVSRLWAQEVWKLMELIMFRQRWNESWVVGDEVFGKPASAELRELHAGWLRPRGRWGRRRTDEAAELIRLLDDRTCRFLSETQRMLAERCFRSERPLRFNWWQRDQSERKRKL